MSSDSEEIQYCPIFTALLEDNVPGLVAIINKTPIWDTVDTIVSTLPIASETFPKLCVKMAATIEAIPSAPNLTPMIIVVDGMTPTRVSTADQLKRCVDEMVRSSFSTENRPRGYTDLMPKSEFLITALVSGACERTGLCRLPEQKDTIYVGLQFPGYDMLEKELWKEIYAIHACLALLIGGSSTYVAINEAKPGLLAPALQKIADEDIIQFEGGKKLLELTIQQVESEFSTELETEEIWTTLFSDDMRYSPVSNDDNPLMREFGP